MRRLVALGCAAAIAGAARADEAPPPDATAQPTLVIDPMVITATRLPQPASESPSPVTVLGGAELRRAPAKTLDEALRIDPSLGLFRRSSALVADPTSQGLNLRGIGPSGVSRALLLEDGVPQNDGFGGWIYWPSLQRGALDRVEIASGGSSALYGSSALGGVVQLVSRPIEDGMELRAEGGSYGTAAGSLVAGNRGERLATGIEAEAQATGGYDIVAPSARGAVDHPASSRYATVRGRAELAVSERVTAFARASLFSISEDGGTQYTTAAARRGELVAGATGESPSLGRADVRVFARAERFDQERARILPDITTRTSEQLASSQMVPANDEGLGATWSLAPQAGHRPMLGVDFRRSAGHAREHLYTGSIALRDSGGEQQLAGAFMQDAWSPWERLQIFAALRGDLWRNLGGVHHEEAVGGTATDSPLPDRSGAQLSPRLAARLRLAPWIALRGAGYRSFRAPTLNELYRPFQTGAVRTDPNPALVPESFTGGEGGVDLSGPLTTALRATGYAGTLERPITNVTVGQNLQQRQNLGAARVRGVEVEASAAPLPRLQLRAAYTFVDAVVTEAASPLVLGKQLPQDPSHRVSASVSFDDPALLSAILQVRWISTQFEDDQNQLPLAGYAVVDAAISRRLSPRWEAFAAAENLFDRTYLVGRQGGIPMIGQPIFLHAGLRFRSY